MKLYLYSNLLGSYIFSDEGKKVDQILYSSDFIPKVLKLNSLDWNPEELSLLKKHSSEKIMVINKKDDYINNAIKFDENYTVLEKVLGHFLTSDFQFLLRQRNFELVKYQLQNNSITDTFVIQAVNNMDELDHSINTLAKRLREWYELYFPEISRKVTDHKKFAELVFTKEKKEMMEEHNFEESIGTAVSKNDLEPMKNLAEQILALAALKDKHLEYLDTIMDDVCPNTKALCGTAIAAKLMSLGGGLFRLSKFASSTVQTLGAEKAMFRHLKTGSKPPKYGIILMHPLVANAGRNKGKAARMLANKISLAVKIDYFKGDSYKGYELKDDLEREIKKL